MRPPTKIGEYSEPSPRYNTAPGPPEKPPMNVSNSVTSLGSLTDTTMQQIEETGPAAGGAEQHSELSIEPTKLQRLDLGAFLQN